MKLKEMWREETLKTLRNVYGDKLDEKVINSYLDKLIKNSYDPVMRLRNIYTCENFEKPLNDILDIIHQEDLCVSANNTLTYSYNKIKSPIPRMLIEKKAERGVHKTKAKKLKTEITKMEEQGIDISNEPIVFEQSFESSLELKIKVFMNSIYGVEGQPGSIIYSPDTAGAITSQGRQLISEMMWSIERTLYGTIHFSTIGEFFSYINQIKAEARETELMDYISYIPTDDDITNVFSDLYLKLLNNDKYGDVLPRAIYLFVSNLTPTERIYVYYKSNLLKFIANNHSVLSLFEKILSSPTEFLAAGDKTPAEFLPTVKILCSLVEEFVIPKVSTPRRVFKYVNKRRRGIIVSDTDSIMINLDPYVKFVSKWYCNKHKVKYNESMTYKMINIMASICVKATEVAGDIFCKGANIPKELRNWVEMKNEFFFSRLCMYMGAKKNYIVHTALQEGEYRNEVSATGIKLNSSTVNPEVTERIMKIIEEKILKAEEIRPIEIFGEVKSLEKMIVQKVVNGDLTYGKKARFSGAKGYKSTLNNNIHPEGKSEKLMSKAEKAKYLVPVPGIYSNNMGRSALIWNILNPNNKIESGDYMYIFDTSIFRLSDAEDIKYKYPEVYDRLKNLIFENPEEKMLPRYGLSSIGIPLNETTKKIPEWIIPYIDYENLTNKHLQPIISLLPSIYFNISKISSNKGTYSPIVSY